MQSAPDYDAIADRWGSWWLAYAIKREQGVRAGTIPPLDDNERRQASEGPCDETDYDCVRFG